MYPLRRPLDIRTAQCLKIYSDPEKYSPAALFGPGEIGVLGSGLIEVLAAHFESLAVWADDLRPGFRGVGELPGGLGPAARTRNFMVVCFSVECHRLLSCTIMTRAAAGGKGDCACSGRLPPARETTLRRPTGGKRSSISERSIATILLSAKLSVTASELLRPVSEWGIWVKTFATPFEA